jgi:hypothetical protein
VTARFSLYSQGDDIASENGLERAVAALIVGCRSRFDFARWAFHSTSASPLLRNNLEDKISRTKGPDRVRDQCEPASTQ